MDRVIHPQVARPWKLPRLRGKPVVFRRQKSYARLKRTRDIRL